MSTRLVTIVVFFSMSLAWPSNLAAREWTDQTGKYRVEAELIDFTDEVVRLRREDGQVIAVPLEKLSLGDQQFVAQKSTQKVSGIPELLEPQPRAVLDNGRRDRRDTCTWEFKWGEVEGAEGYELFVLGPGARVPLVNRVVDKPFYRSTSRCYVIERNRRGWTWKVRAIRDGQRLPWSKTRTFDVEPLDTDPPKQKPAKAANANPTKTTKPSQKDTLEGLWRVKGLVGHEAAPDKDPLAGLRMMVEVRGDSVTLLCGAIDEQGIKQWTFKVLPDQAPNRLELSREGPPLPPQYAWLPNTLCGTYELADDALRIASLGELKIPFPAAVQGRAFVIELVRIDAEHAEAIRALQGIWKVRGFSPSGFFGHEETFVFVEGEWVLQKVVGKDEPRRWSPFGLHGRAKPGDARALALALIYAKRLLLGTASDVREATFPRVSSFRGVSHDDKEVNGLFARTDGGKMLFYYKDGLGGLVWEPTTAEHLAAAELKHVMSKWLLAEKKQDLHKFVAQYADTQAAEQARQELDRMPPDEEIAELDADKYLKQAEGFIGRREPLRAKQQLRLLIGKYPNTEVAKEAKEEIERLPPDDEAREIEAATFLKRALKIPRSRSRASAATNRNERNRRLRLVITHHAGTKAAAEAARLLAPKVQREEQATNALIPAKILFTTKPEAGRDWLRKVETEYPGTEAAEEARRLLDETR